MTSESLSMDSVFSDEYEETPVLSRWSRNPWLSDLSTQSQEKREELKRKYARMIADYLEGVLTSTGRTVSRYPVVVKFVETGPAPAFSMGDEIKIVLEGLDASDLNDVLVMVGLLLHETLHAMFTPRAYEPISVWAREKRLFSTFNLLEDQRIESLGTVLWPGVGPRLIAILRRFIITSPDPSIHALVHGRRYLPLTVRQFYRDMWQVAYGDSANEVADLIDEYRTFTFPTDTDRAKQVIERMAELMPTPPDGPCKKPGKGGKKGGLPMDNPIHPEDKTTGGEVDTTAPLRQEDEERQKELSDKLEKKDKKGEKTSDSKLEQEDKDDKNTEEPQEGGSEGEDKDGDSKDQGGKDEDSTEGNEPEDGDSEGDGKGDADGDDSDSKGDDPDADTETSAAGNGSNHAPTSGDDGSTAQHKDGDPLGDLDKYLQEEMNKGTFDDMVRALDRAKDYADEANPDGKKSRPVTPVGLESERRLEEEFRQLLRHAATGRKRRTSRGRLNVRRWINTADPDISWDRWHPEAKDAASIECVILGDVSGSISNGTAANMTEMAWAIKRALEAMTGPEVTVIAFNTEHTVLYEARERAKDNSAVPFISYGGTEPLSALKLARQIFDESTKKSKLLFCITDGCWYDQRSTAEWNREHMADVSSHVIGVQGFRVNDVWQTHGFRFGANLSIKQLAQYIGTVVVGDIKTRLPQN